jgi:uncharacterized repeat protein (TIGR03803 family)
VFWRENATGVVLENLSGRSGTWPAAELMQGTDGALYGTASSGGLEGVGTIFRLNTDGSGFTVLHDCSASEGT